MLSILVPKVNSLSRPLEKIGSRVFDAASSPIRMGMLHLLTSKGPLPYTEIMFSLKLDPVRDAGKFVYHLRNLQDAGLITYDKETKKYSLTELGGIVIDFARDVEEYVVVKKGKLFVRTSKLSIEEFDRGRITKSLMVEAGVPYELAEEIATEAEERLIHLKTTYLTAPLIREFVNSILIERKLEEYRHKLTRLGMPVHDVTQSLKAGREQMLDVESIRKAAGSSVMEEYVLLNCLPREISDAHMSGQLHIDNLGEWILKPSEFQHDLRHFLRNGLPNIDPPRNFSSALALIRDIYQRVSSEVSSEQSFDMFNIFLAPYVKNEPDGRIVEALELFMNSIRMGTGWSGHPAMSLAYEFNVPAFLREAEAVGPEGRNVGSYGVFENEAKLLLIHTIDVIGRLSASAPVTNPRLIFKLREETFRSEQFGKELLSAHSLASTYLLPYFALLNDDEKASYTATGLRLDDSWTGFWETDCQRTGCMDTVFVNLPRIAYGSRKNDDRFQELLAREVDLTVKAFQIKKKYINDRIQESWLPVLSGFGKSDSYIHSENSLYAISPIGLNEAVMAHVGSNLSKKDAEASDFALKMMQEMSRCSEEAAEELDMRFALANRPGDDASVRLAQLDVEEYGMGSVVCQGIKKHPYYTDLVTIPSVEEITLEDRLMIEGKFQSLTEGGHLLPINLASSNLDPNALMKLTKRIHGDQIKFFTYSGVYSICNNCQKWSIGIRPTCSFCGSNNIRQMGRSSATMKPLSIWPDGKARTLDRVLQYPPS